MTRGIASRGLIHALPEGVQSLPAVDKSIPHSKLPLSPSGATLAKLLTLAILVAVAVLGAATWDDLRAAVEVLRKYFLGRTFLLVSQALLGINIAAFAWRLVLVLRYKPTAACTDDQLPLCTVLVPAYNEGPLVLETIRSLLSSDYPVDKLQIIGIDDGSRDDTWDWLRKGAEESAGRAQVFRLASNMGKRHALHHGFLHSMGEVIVTVDSDSVVCSDTLRRLVSPFVGDSRVGAVAGNVRVLNRRDGLIPRMLDVSFAYSFDFIRASQSEVDTVICTPGALSAYRRDMLTKVMDKWLHQTWLGRPANIGEDRALTNLILRQGMNVKFQSDAVVWTKVPVEHKGLCRMFLRWARSNVRETIAMSAFAFGRFRSGGATGARVNLLLQWVSMVLPPLMMLAAAACIMWRPTIYLVHIMLGTAIASCVPACFYALRHRDTNALWAFLYGFYWLACLWWINPYAILTAHKDRWMTRDLPAPAARPRRAA